MNCYPKLQFDTGIEVDGLDVAEWVAQAHYYIHQAHAGLEVSGHDEESREAARLAKEVLALLGRLKVLSEEAGP